jgi:hypothetical protein
MSWASRRSVFALATLAIAFSVAGCAGGGDRLPAPLTVDPAAETSTPAAVATSSAAPGHKGLSASEDQALGAELSAIESELGKTELPADGDFDGIGAGLQ